LSVNIKPALNAAPRTDAAVVPMRGCSGPQYKTINPVHIAIGTKE